MPRKLPQHAFEEAHPEAAAAVRKWFFEEKPACSIEEASGRLESRFQLRYSPETMRKFWHRCQKLQTEKDSLRAYLIEAGEMAAETLKVQDHTLFLRASIVQVGALCNRLLAERKPEPETVEKLGNLMTMLVTGAREVRSAEALEFDREKFQFNAAEQAIKHAAALKQISADSSLTDRQKIDAARIRLFGSAPA